MKVSTLKLGVLLLFTVVLFVCSGTAQTVLDRARLGNNTEDITFISKGPFADHIAILDGYKVLGVPVEGGEVSELFDLQGLEINIGPRGIAYIGTEQLFALVEPTQLMTLVLTDEEGQSRGTRPIRYLGGFMPEHLEGLAYLPSTSRFFPDHLVMVALRFSPTLTSRLEVLRRDGQVVAEILPAQPVGSEFITGVSFLAPDRLLVGLDDNTIWVLNFSGGVVAGPVRLPGVEDIEGLVQVPDGRVAAAAYNAGTLFFFDQNLNRRPDEDLDYSIGVGLSRPDGVGWNTDTNEHLVAQTPALPQMVAVQAVPPSLDSATPVVDLAAGRFMQPRAVTYLPDESLIAVAHANVPRAILLYDNDGTLVERIDLSALGRPRALTYIPTTEQFAVRVTEQPRLLYIRARNGSAVRTIDLSPTGINVAAGVAFFNPDHPSGGQFLIFDSFMTNRAIVTDFDGKLLSEFNYRKVLGLLSPSGISAITTGPQAGAFSVTDGDNSEIVIFRLE